MNNPPKLPFYEKLAACLILSALATLAIFNWRLAEPELPPTTEPVPPSTPLIEVTIKGTVKQPGTYQVRKGATVRDALDFAHLLPTADLKRLKLDAKILRRRTITVPETKQLKRRTAAQP